MTRAAVCAIALILCAAPVARTQQCTPPDEIKSKLAGTPTPDALNEAGIWFAQHEQYPCAIEAFATSLQTDPEQKDLRHIIFMFGASLYYAGSNKEAVAALQEAERVGYRDVKLYLLLASALDAEQQTEEAEAAWREALAFDPEGTIVLDALSDDMIARHEFSNVIDLLQQPRLKAGHTPKQVRNLATALGQSGRNKEAALILEDGLNTYPDSREIAQQLAEVLTTLHREQEAAMVLELAK